MSEFDPGYTAEAQFGQQQTPKGTDGVTVVIPMYQAANWIEETLESVMRQTSLPRQVIVIDDGSTDGSATVCAELARQSPVDVSIVIQENMGQARSRNRAISLVATEYIAFLDSDDVWLPRKLELQLLSLTRSGAEATTCGYVAWTPGAKQPRDFITFDWQETSLEEWSLGYGVGPALASTLLISTVLIRRLGGFREDMSVFTDLDFSLRLQRTAKVLGIPEPLVAYRQHAYQIHRQSSSLAGEAAFFAAVNLDSNRAKKLCENIAILSYLRHQKRAKILQKARASVTRPPMGRLSVIRFLARRLINRRRATKRLPNGFERV